MKINKIVVDNKKITEDLEMANSFNEYFSKIGKTLSDNIETIYLQPVNYFEIENIIRKMKAKKGEVDNINSKVLKAICIYIADAFFIYQI